MQKPMIGVLPLFDTERDSLWLVPGYMDGLAEAGALPVMLPLTTDTADISMIAETFNGFLFTGGQDIDPSYYNATDPEHLCGEHCHARDIMEQQLFHEVLKKDKPMLGICRGIQVFNVFCGGTLWCDLPTERPSSTEHHQQPPYDKPVHRIDIVSGTPLHALVGIDRLMVNSYHHQAVKQLAPGLSAMAYSEDGLAEAVYMPDKHFVWAVQWHPEFSCTVSEESRMIFREFVKNCK